ncbi:TPA: PD-(D/E)XK nuclease family protein, partial [Pseudomonas aeruginosa]
GTAHKSRLHDSALGYLLGDGQSLAASKELTNWLDPLINPLRSTAAVVPEASQQSYAATQEDLPPVQWSTPVRSAAEHWWIASYSALRFEEGATAPASRHDDAAPDSLAMQNSTDDDSSDAVPAALLTSAQGLHRFPRGSNPGTFLHGLLELAAVEGFAHCLANPAQLREAVARRCQRRGLEAWIDPLCEWLSAFLSQQMALGGGGSVSLADLTQYQSELEFWFEAQQVDVIQLDRMVRSTELPGVPRQPLQADTLNGMFKGFIDLAFEYQGRYYVVDYKSNWLGADDGAYTREAMEASMAAHRYDLQYVLYVLALHRQLRLRLPDYDYDRDMGGALYLFMRAPGNGVYQVRPAKALIEQLDTLFLGQSQESFA